VKPVPTPPTKTNFPSSSYMPSTSEPTIPARRPSPGFHPAMTTSTVLISGVLIQYRDRAPGWYGESSRLATTPSSPCSAAASSRSLPASSAQYGGVLATPPASPSSLRPAHGRPAQRAAVHNYQVLEIHRATEVTMSTTAGHHAPTITA
jgi:hypothetical protein